MQNFSLPLKRRQLILAAAAIGLDAPTWAQVGAAVSRGMLQRALERRSYAAEQSLLNCARVLASR